MYDADAELCRCSPVVAWATQSELDTMQRPESENFVAEPRHSASSWLTKSFWRSTQRFFEASSVMESEVPSQSAVDSEVPSSTTEPTKTSLQDADVQSHEEAFLASSSAFTVSAYQTL